jgi:hypothetical protein
MLRSFKLVCLLALAGALLTACASLIGPRDIALPLVKLQTGLERRFPITNRMLEVFDVELSRPQLAMQPDSGRVALTLDTSVAVPFLHRTRRGNLVISGRLFVDPARSALMMAEPRVESFVLDGVDDTRQAQLTAVANLVMQKFVADTPLYHFRPEDLRYGGVQFVPTRIAATPSGLLVSVAPAR